MHKKTIRKAYKKSHKGIPFKKITTKLVTAAVASEAYSDLCSQLNNKCVNTFNKLVY